jgi:ABC-2 type transport system ATP-binding protein
VTLLLDLHELSRTFAAHRALNGLTLQVPQGLLGLLGPNGAGKSTLLKILMGLIAPSSGTGRVLDVPLGGDRDARDNWRLRRLIGFMPEADALVPGMKGIEYVALAGELYGMPRKQALRRAHEVLTYLDLEEARYRNVEDYSAGMKQRAKLAQALVHDPPVLLLDEPTSGLDPAGRDTMLKLIRELGDLHGKSIILSTHLLADVQAVCERAVIIAGGELRGYGTVAELCARRDDRYRIRFAGPKEPFEQALIRAGVRIVAEAAPRELRVILASDHTTLDLFRIAAESGAGIRAVLRDDVSLEELFLLATAPAAEAA